MGAELAGAGVPAAALLSTLGLASAFTTGGRWKSGQLSSFQATHPSSLCMVRRTCHHSMLRAGTQLAPSPAWSDVLTVTACSELHRAQPPALHGRMHLQSQHAQSWNAAGPQFCRLSWGTLYFRLQSLS